MDFEDILHDVGDFGLYQRLLTVVFLLPSFVIIPWFTMNSIFINSSPDHWCRVPELMAGNITADMRRKMISPVLDSSCAMYDVDYGGMLQQGSNWTADPEWHTKECDSGWEYDQTNYDATSVTRWNMVCRDGHYSSLVISLVFIGDLIGTPFYGWLSDKWGRKPIFLFMAFVVAVSEIGSVLSPNFVVFLALRTTMGASTSTLYILGYILLVELVGPNRRVLTNGLLNTSWTLGLCLLALVAYLTRNWIKLSIVTSVTAASMLLYWFILPESPSWLISQERYEEAAEIMAKISKTNGKKAHEGNKLTEDIKRLGELKKKQRVSKWKHSPMDFFRYPTLRKRFLLVTVCWAGISIPYFGLQVNVKNLEGDAFFNFFLVSLIELPAHFCFWTLMEKIGRRWSSVMASALSTVACIIPVIFPPGYTSVGVACSLLAKFGSSSALMIVCQQAPELFPTALRGVGMGMACAFSTGSSLIVPYIVYLAKFDKKIPFLVFSAVSFVACTCAAFLPETLNKKLPQTAEDAENFQTKAKFFSFRVQDDEEEKTGHVPKQEGTWRHRKLSVIDLMSPKFDVPQKKRISFTSVAES